MSKTSDGRVQSQREREREVGRGRERVVLHSSLQGKDEVQLTPNCSTQKSVTSL